MHSHNIEKKHESERERERLIANEEKHRSHSEYVIDVSPEAVGPYRNFAREYSDAQLQNFFQRLESEIKREPAVNLPARGAPLSNRNRLLVQRNEIVCCLGCGCFPCACAIEIMHLGTRCESGEVIAFGVVLFGTFLFAAGAWIKDAIEKRDYKSLVIGGVIFGSLLTVGCAVGSLLPRHQLLSDEEKRQMREARKANQQFTTRARTSAVLGAVQIHGLFSTPGTQAEPIILSTLISYVGGDSESNAYVEALKIERERRLRSNH